jgi:hypothetical protein
VRNFVFHPTGTISIEGARSEVIISKARAAVVDGILKQSLKNMSEGVAWTSMARQTVQSQA